MCKKLLIISELFGLGSFVIIITAFFLWSNGFRITLLPLLIIVEIISAICDTTFVPSETLTLTNLDENRRAESYGIVAFLRGIGIIPTGFIAGILIESVHYITPFIFTLVGTIFLIWFLLKYFENDVEKSDRKVM
ncbi:MAG: MFS transporter [Promethearchaeota archaeon]